MRTEDDLRGMFETLTQSAGDVANVQRSIDAPRHTRPSRTARVAIGGVLAAAAIVAITVFLPAHDTSHPPLIGASDAEADPVVVLRSAASAAKADPDVVPRPDQFYYVRAGSAESWLSMDGEHDGQIHFADGTVLLNPGCRNGVAWDTGNSKVPRPIPCTPDPAYVSDAPMQPGAMASYLQTRFGETNGIGKGALDLLTNRYLRAGARAAIFEALTRIPGLMVVNSGVPPRFVGVKWTFGGGSTMLLFDRSSHTYVDIQTVGEKGEISASSPTAPVTAIVDQVGQRP